MENQLKPKGRPTANAAELQRGLTNSLGVVAQDAAMLSLLLLNAVLHAAEGSSHALNEAVLNMPVVLLHLQMPKHTSLTHGSLLSNSV